MKKILIISSFFINAILAQESKEEQTIFTRQPLRYQLLPIEIRREIFDMAGLNEPISKALSCNYLQVSVYSNQFDDVQLLVNCGADINKKPDNHKASPLCKAAYGLSVVTEESLYKKYQILQYLILRNADLNLQDKDGSTALHYAAYSANNSAVKTLLAKKANPNITNINGDTPLDVVHQLAMGDTTTYFRKGHYRPIVFYKTASIFAQYGVTSKIPLKPLPVVQTQSSNTSRNMKDPKISHKHNTCAIS